MNNFSTAIADGIIKYLSEHPEIIDSKNSKKENCPWMFDKDSGIITTVVKTKENFIKHLTCQFGVNNDSYMLLFTFPFLVNFNDIHVLDTTYLITCINYNLFRGNFDLDIYQGTLFYRDYVICNDIYKMDQLLTDSLNNAFSTIKKYECHILDLILKNSDVIEIANRIMRKENLSEEENINEDFVDDLEDEENEDYFGLESQDCYENKPSCENDEENSDDQNKDSSEIIIRDPFKKDDIKQLRKNNNEN
jgi:hypothetical protein